MVTPLEWADSTPIFEKGSVKTRLLQLTTTIMGILVSQDVKAMAKDHRKQGDIPPPYPLGADEIEEKFGGQARAEACRILEAERQLYVDRRSASIKTELTRIVKALKLLVLVDGRKGKHYIEKRVEKRGKDFDLVGVPYFESYPEGVDRLLQIHGVAMGLNGIRDYAPYLAPDLKALFDEADDLGTLEIVDLNAEKRKLEYGKAKKTAKTRKET